MDDDELLLLRAKVDLGCLITNMTEYGNSEKDQMFTD